MTRSIAWLVVVAAVLGCGDPESSNPARDATPVRKRVVPPRPGRVRAVPPHNLHPNGIGPYKINATLKEIFRLVAYGPRLETLYIEQLFHFSVVRADNDGLLIGVDPTDGVRYLAAIRDIVHAQGGPIVGIEVFEAERRLGGELVSPRGADPRLFSIDRLPHVRVIAASGRVAAVMVTGERDEPKHDATTPAPAPEPVTTCDGLDDVRKAADRVIAVSGLGGGPVEVGHGCSGGPIAVVTAGDRLAVVAGDAGHLRRSSLATVGGMVYAAPIDIDADGRDEVLAVARRYSPSGIAYRIEAFDAELAPIATRPLFDLTGTAVALVGAEQLSDTDLLFEIAPAGVGEISVGGVYLQRRAGQLYNAVPIDRRMIEIRRGNRAPPAIDAGAGAAVDTEPGKTVAKPGGGP